MYLPTTIFLYMTRFSMNEVIQHVKAIPSINTCTLISLETKKQLLNFHQQSKNFCASDSMLITDADFFLSKIPASIFPKTPPFHASTQTPSTLPLPTLGIFEDNELPSLSSDFSKIPYIFEGIQAITEENLSFVFYRFHKLPLIVLETDRLQLREWALTDVQSFFALYQSFPVSDQLHCPAKTREEVPSFLSSYIHGAYEFYGHGLWCIIEKQSHSIIGQCGIEYKERNEVSRYELQYMITPSAQQKGYGFEICQAVCNYARKELSIPELFALILPHNARSIQLIQKLGFHLEEEIDIDGQTTLLYKICFPHDFSL